MVRFSRSRLCEVLAAVTMPIYFRDVMLCSLVAMYQCFGGTCCLHRRDRRALFLLFNILDVFFVSHVREWWGYNDEYHCLLLSLVIAFSGSACASAIISSLRQNRK
jgi:hypothetical protein